MKVYWRSMLVDMFLFFCVLFMIILLAVFMIMILEDSVCRSPECFQNFTTTGSLFKP